MHELSLLAVRSVQTVWTGLVSQIFHSCISCPDVFQSTSHSAQLTMHDPNTAVSSPPCVKVQSQFWLQLCRWNKVSADFTFRVQTLSQSLKFSIFSRMYYSKTYFSSIPDTAKKKNASFFHAYLC